MRGDRRVRATWLLLVLYTGLCLGACAIVIAKFQLPCCPDVRYEEASLSACCSSDLSVSSELPVMVHTATPPSETLFVIGQRATNEIDPRLHNTPVSFHPANPQALLSTFLI